MILRVKLNRRFIMQQNAVGYNHVNFQRMESAKDLFVFLLVFVTNTKQENKACSMVVRLEGVHG